MPAPTDRPTKKTFHDLVRTAWERPHVRLVVDLTDFDTKELVSFFDNEESMMTVLVQYARSFGSLVEVKTFVPARDESKEWVGQLAKTTHTDVYSYVKDINDRGIIILVGTDPTLHNDVAELLAVNGNLVIMLGREARENAAVARHDLVFYMSLSKLSNKGEKLDLDKYDFEEFIKLLYTCENSMPFVGAKYFINKVMWRLGHADPTVSQKVFQAARDGGLVDIAKSDNVDPNSPYQVSSCKLNREHEQVKKVLAKIQDSSVAGFSNKLDLSKVTLDQQDDTSEEQG